MNAINVNYDELLAGQVRHLDLNNFYGSPGGGRREREAVSCIRYVLEDVLLWTPDDSAKKLDRYMIRLMKLDHLIRHIVFPVEVPYGDPKYILSLAYPDRFHIDKRKMVEQVYRNVLSADLDEGSALKQFPRDYFSGAEGFTRFCLCLAYLVENIRPVGSVSELYSFFMSPEGKKCLYDNRLKVPADQFSVDILSVIHAVAGESDDNEFYYSRYRFEDMWRNPLPAECPNP